MEAVILETVERLFDDHLEQAFAALPEQADDGAAAWLPELWAQVEELGLPLALLSEDQGGFGVSPLVGLSIVRLASSRAIPLPIGETMVANLLLAMAGLPLAEGPATLAVGPDLTGTRLTGQAPRVAFGRNAQTVVALCGDQIARAPAGQVTEQSHNLAAEARDTLSWDASVEAAPSPVSDLCFRGLGALLRAQGLAGALEAAVDMTAAYANERQQFGRPIGKFQAIQQQLAVAAAETAAARAGADMAAGMLPLATTNPTGFIAAVAAAKLRSGEAAGKVAGIAHQVHGAIGFTREYRLHALTRRMWAWREEWGNEAEWADYLGGQATGLGPDQYWPFLTDIGECA